MHSTLNHSFFRNYCVYRTPVVGLLKLFPSWKIAILLQQQQQFIFCFCALLLNPNYYCAWWQNPFLKTKQVCTFHKPAPKHEMREGRVSAPWTGMLYFVFCFCFISIIVHLNWQEREKKICDVLLKKKFEKKIWDQKKTIQFPILESTSGGTGSHSESKSLPFNCYILLLILVAITWFERIDLSSIASESFLTQKK